MRTVRNLTLRGVVVMTPVVLAAIGSVIFQANSTASTQRDLAVLAGASARADQLSQGHAVFALRTDQLLAAGAFGSDVAPLANRSKGAAAIGQSLGTDGVLAALEVSDGQLTDLTAELGEIGVAIPRDATYATKPLSQSTFDAIAGGDGPLNAARFANALTWFAKKASASGEAGRAAQADLIAVAKRDSSPWGNADDKVLIFGVIAIGIAGLVYLRWSIGRDLTLALADRTRLERKTGQLEALFSVVRRLNSTLEIGEVAKQTVEQAASSTESEFALLTLVEGHDLVPAAMIGPVHGARAAVYHGLCGRVVDAGRPSRAIVNAEPVLGALGGPLSLCAAPLVAGGHVVGVLIVGRVGDAMMPEEAELALQHLSLCAGPAIDAARQHGSTAELALVDALTGLHNKRRLDQDLVNVLGRCAREKRPVSVMMIDVDHFKRFNDTFGHPAGDAALRRVAGIVRSCVREHDTVYRFGGEELAVLLPATHIGDALAVAERVRAGVALDTEPGTDGSKRLTVSVGVATTITHELAELMSRSDAALYEAKESGRNLVVAAKGSTER